MSLRLAYPVSLSEQLHEEQVRPTRLAAAIDQYGSAVHVLARMLADVGESTAGVHAVLQSDSPQIAETWESQRRHLLNRLGIFMETIQPAVSALGTLVERTKALKQEF